MTIDSMFFCDRNAARAARSPLVMAIDDDSDSLLLVQYALEGFGFAFVGESDSRLALAVAKQHQPDLILLDILLPNLSGMDVIRLLKQDAQTCQIPVIAVTALASDDNRQLLLKAGFEDHISKPYMLDDLEAIVRQYSSRPVSQV